MPQQQDARLALIHEWLTRDLARRVTRIEVASADASFRRYFRVFAEEATLIVMDAPPGKEDVRPYLHVSRLLEDCEVHVPHVHASDAARGLVLLEDLGSTPYLVPLSAGREVERLYGDALAALADIQVRGLERARELAPYDGAALEREMQLMPEWFCATHLRLALSASEQALLRATFDYLIAQALAQPVVFVHRDYHSRNLMCTAQRNPGVIDFQDALAGPIGYDLASLLKDCYIAWPRERVEQWVSCYHGLLLRRGFALEADAQRFLRWFDLIGVQRHIKVLGIFARLFHRDGKSGYLADLPR
ncbi:MAG TPA: phosphotransferase, partial [Steroidobacteraceae bacterium]